MTRACAATELEVNRRLAVPTVLVVQVSAGARRRRLRSDSVVRCRWRAERHQSVARRARRHRAESRLRSVACNRAAALRPHRPVGERPQVEPLSQARREGASELAEPTTAVRTLAVAPRVEPRLLLPLARRRLVLARVRSS